MIIGCCACHRILTSEYGIRMTGKIQHRLDLGRGDDCHDCRMQILVYNGQIGTFDAELNAVKAIYAANRVDHKGNYFIYLTNNLSGFETY